MQDTTIVPFMHCMEPPTFQKRRECVIIQCEMDVQAAHQKYREALRQFNKKMQQPLLIEQSQKAYEEKEVARKATTERSAAQRTKELLHDTKWAYLFGPSPLLETVYHAGCRRGHIYPVHGCLPDNHKTRCADHQESLAYSPEVFVCQEHNPQAERLKGIDWHMQQMQAAYEKRKSKGLGYDGEE